MFDTYKPTEELCIKQLLCLFPAAGPCIEVDGMQDPQIIPDENIQTPSGSTGSLREGDDSGPLTITAPGIGSPAPEVIVDLTSDDYPEAPELGDLTLPTSTNVEKFTVYIQPTEGAQFEPLDIDEDNLPDVSLRTNILVNPA